MLAGHLRRGATAGAVGGLGYGLFVALVGNPLVGAAEAFEVGSHEAAVSGATAVAVGVGAGIVWGVALGVVVFGVAYYVLAPAIPGAPGTKSYVLAAAGFLVLSGGPWLALPPQPPGVEPALPTETRIVVYAVGMGAAALAVGLGGYAYGRLRGRGRAVTVAGGVAPLALVAAYAVLAPPNPVEGPLPAELHTAFQWAVVFGQLWLWLCLSATHAWLVGRVKAPAGETATPELSR